ncbi:MAG TPA: SRPBCC family protein [Angustibacter sp.]|nr:SRPBCC family protein [Angustibacter sp.]
MADRTESSTVVEAAPADVLALIADFDAYPEWTGAVKSAQVLARGTAGRAKQVRFELDAGAIKDTYVLEYAWKVAKAGTGTVTWWLVEAENVLKALDGSYTLTGEPGGPTTVTYQLAVDVRIPMLGMLKRKAEKGIISTALQELKKRAEG